MTVEAPGARIIELARNPLEKARVLEKARHQIELFRLEDTPADEPQPTSVLDRAIATVASIDQLAADPLVDEAIRLRRPGRFESLRTIASSTRRFSLNVGWEVAIGQGGVYKELPTHPQNSWVVSKLTQADLVEAYRLNPNDRAVHGLANMKRSAIASRFLQVIR